MTLVGTTGEWASDGEWAGVAIGDGAIHTMVGDGVAIGAGAFLVMAGAILVMVGVAIIPTTATEVMATLTMVQEEEAVPIIMEIEQMLTVEIIQLPTDMAHQIDTQLLAETPQEQEIV